MPELTKEQLSQQSGISVEEITDNMLKAAQAELPPDAPAPETKPAGTTTEGKPEETPSKAPEWKDPEGWDQHYYKRSDLESLEPDKALADEKHPFHALVKKVYGDPQRDEQHPFHKQTRDLKAEASRKAQEAEDLRRKLEDAERIAAQFASQPLVDDDNNPALGVYGGIKEDYESESGYTDKDGNPVRRADYIRAVNAYDRTENERKQRFNQHKESQSKVLVEIQSAWDGIAAEYDELSKAHPDLKRDEIMTAFMPTLRDGRENPNFKGTTPLDTIYIHQAQAAGGWDKFLSTKMSEALAAKDAEWKGLIEKAGLQLDAIKAGGALAGNGTQPVNPPVGRKNDYTAEEIERMTPAEREQARKSGAFDHILPPRSRTEW